MSQDPQCHNESKDSPGPGTSSAAPDSRAYTFHGDLVKIPEWNTSKGRVKRRKTKKQLDNTKFKSHNEVFKKKALPRGFPQRNNMVGKTIPRSGGNDASNPMRVFITENRLTQHQGIFNREIKSIDIGRLVNQEVVTSKTGTAPCATVSVRDTPQSQRSLSLGLIPTPELKNKEVPVPEKEHSPVILADTSEPAQCDQQGEESEKCDHQGEESVKCDQQGEESVKCQPCPQSDDHVNPGSEAATSPCKNQPAPVLETADSIVNILSAHSLFPGRNLIKEARQAILEKERNLRDAKTTPFAVAVQKKLEYNHIGNADLYKDQGWECVGKGKTDIRKTFPRPQRAMPIQTSPIRFRSIPKDSPPHTLIKMPGREDHLKLKDNLPIHYGPDCDPSYQNQQISSQSPHSLLNINSSSNDSRQQDINISSFHRIRRARPMASPPMNAHSPKVRWRLADDILTDLSYTHNSPSGSMRHNLTSHVTNQECVCRTSLEDIFSKAPNPPKLGTKQQFSHEKTSDVFWGSRDRRSPTTNIDNIFPASIRWSYRAQSPPRMYTARNFTGQQMPVTFGSQGVFPLESGRETKGHVSSWLEADIGQHWERCATNTRPKQQHMLESRCHNCWNPQFLLQDEPKHRVHMENDGDIQERYMSVALSPHSVQQRPSFVPCQHSKSSKRASTKSSPATWRYPRMKLY